jgi:hypothetical protein
MKPFGQFILLCSVTILFSFCNDHNEPIIKDPVVVPTAPEWSVGYPLFPYSAVTVDIVLKADKNSNVYWILSDQELSLTPQQLKEQVSAATNSAILFKGVVLVSANTEKVETVSGLTQSKKYFTYIVGESVTGLKLQPTVKSFNFTTNRIEEVKPDPPVQITAPEWIAGYPRVPFGAVTADLILKADKKSNVYWIIADQEIYLTPEQLKAQASIPTNGAIRYQGVVLIEPNSEKTEVVAGLAENKKYFTYLVCEDVADLKIQSVVKSFNFTTYNRQEKRQYASTAENRNVLYLIYRPESVLKYPEKKAPICFFLGGNGEVAAQGEINMIRNGSLPEYISKGNGVPMMVMSIQHTVMNWNSNLIDEGVNHALATYPVDTKKVYMTGISGGGFGCWNYALGHASKLTAIVPISGGGNTSIACNLKAVPIWAFHNENDWAVNSSSSKNMINKIKECPPTAEVKLSIFPDDAHDCWRRVYDQNHPDWLVPGKAGIAKVDIYAWLLSKSK